MEARRGGARRCANYFAGSRADVRWQAANARRELLALILPGYIENDVLPLLSGHDSTGQKVYSIGPQVGCGDY